MTRLINFGFYRHIGSGGGAKYVKNRSYRLKELVNHPIADPWKVFGFENYVPIRTNVKDTANSLQSFPS